MSSSTNYPQTLQRGAGPLEMIRYLRVRVRVFMKPSFSIASLLPILALLVDSIVPYRRRAINICQLTWALPVKGKSAATHLVVVYKVRPRKNLRHQS